MKKYIVTILICLLASTVFVGCGSSSSNSVSESDTSSEKEEKKLTDEDFIVNLGKGLEARWTLTNSEEYSEEAMEKMSLAEYQKADALFVNAEFDAIGSLDDYIFEDEELKTIAETYMKGLELQREGIQYQGTDDYSKQDQTWNLGYNYRAVCMNDLYENYGLTVDKKFQEDLDNFVAASATAKRDIAIQDYVNELPEKIEYTKDEEKSDEWSTYYKAVIENTTDYDIDDLEIQVDFLDASGVVIYQATDYLENMKPGAKVQSEIDYDPEIGDFESMQFTITAYHD